MADTRKDKRAPISLKVRFKSATLDEFIEQYSVDISRGGIFIKSKTPMSIGTLLKFEFRLKDESRLIHGVGRVVWKREDEGADKPPGMGIKFIKMDPESRALVEQMVAKRGEAPGRFEEGQEGEEPAAPAASSGGGGFFPSTTPESELPAPEDRTQVRHASEFLASALAEGDAKSASKEAEKKAEEARKRTEEIEKQRAEAKRKPRIKKTLVGVGIPDEAKEAPAIEHEPVAIAKGAIDEEPSESDRPAAKASQPPPLKPKSERPVSLADLDVSESAETKALDRAALEEPSEDEEELAAPAPKKVEAAKFEAPEEDEPDEEEKVEPKPKSERPVAKPAPKEPRAEATPKPRPKVQETPAVAQAAAPEEGGSKNGMIFFAVVAAAAIGLVVYFQMRPPEQTADDHTVAAEPTGGETPPEDPAADPVEDPATDEDPDPQAVQDPVEPVADPEPAVPTTGVRVVTTPEGATVLVNGAEQGTAPLEVQLPVGQAATVAARMTGYTEATEEVTAAAEGQAPVRLTLTQMPYVIHVVTQPAGARVRSPAGTVTAPGDLTLRRPPTSPVALSAQLRGHEDGSLQVQVGDFAESEGRMVANVTLTLTERAQPVRTPPTGGGGRPPRGGTGEAGGGGGGEAAGGGEEAGGGEQPAGGGGTGGGSRPAGGGAQPAGGGAEPAGGGESGGGEEPAPPPPPDNPFG